MCYSTGIIPAPGFLRFLPWNQSPLCAGEPFFGRLPSRCRRTPILPDRPVPWKWFGNCANWLINIKKWLVLRTGFYYFKKPDAVPFKDPVLIGVAAGRRIRNFIRTSERKASMSEKSFVIGVDYGTDSVRSVLVDARTGRTVSSSVFEYPRWKKGLYCDPARNRFRQHPLDYVEGLEKTVRSVVAGLPKSARSAVRGISVDTTGSTPVAVDRRGVPLSLTPAFSKNPNAMFILWKDHTAVEEADEINRVARSWGGTDFTRFEGGVYSSEWFWSKILHTLRADGAVAEAAHSWVEHCDWIPALLTGVTDPGSIKRSRCAAGHKAMWHASWNGLPSPKFLGALDPRLAELRERLYERTFTADVPAGTLSKEWARRLGLPETVTVGTGSFDAHMGAVGAEIEPYHLVKIMGTSTCDMLVAPIGEFGDRVVRGICGQVDGSILPGMLGMEAGQSSFGDVYAWFRDLLTWPLTALLARSKSIAPTTAARLAAETAEAVIPALSKSAAKRPPDPSGTVALDWLNGRRTPDADQRLTAAIAGLSLGSDAPGIFRGLVEATAFGARMINDRFLSEGVPIAGVIAIGGVSKKSPFVMQTVTDVLGMDIRVAKSEQACALGAAMCAAAAAGLYPSIHDAQRAMANGFETVYRPDRSRTSAYDALYRRYRDLGGFVESGIRGGESG
jgi:L-ribulokinase